MKLKIKEMSIHRDYQEKESKCAIWFNDLTCEIFYIKDNLTPEQFIKQLNLMIDSIEKRGNK